MIAETNAALLGGAMLVMLQWGRDQLIAETGTTRTITDAQGRLQWGRDQLIAETCRSCPLAQFGSGVLQWGRDQLIAETALIAERLRMHAEASMGPRSIDRGNAARARRDLKYFSGFNGAAIN